MDGRIQTNSWSSGDFLARIARQYGRARRTWIMDRVAPTEAVLEQIRQAEPPVQYLLGTPKGPLNKLGAAEDENHRAVAQGA